MRTSGIGRILQQVGGMLGGSSRGSYPASTPTRGSRTRSPRTTSRRARSREPVGGTGGLGRMARRLLR